VIFSQLYAFLNSNYDNLFTLLQVLLKVLDSQHVTVCSTKMSMFDNQVMHTK